MKLGSVRLGNFIQELSNYQLLNHQCVGLLVVRGFHALVRCLFILLVNQLCGYVFFGWLVGRLVGLLLSWLFGWLVGWLVGWFVSRSVS
jgi:hypothetical protein